MESKLQDFVKRLRNSINGMETLSETTIHVGWVDEDKKHKAQKKGKAAKGETPPEAGSEMKLVDIARVLNNGRAAGITSSGRKYPAIPARPFVKNCVENHLQPVRKYLGIIGKKVASKEKSEDVYDDKDVKKLALLCKGALQRSIKDSNKYAPNSPRTVKAKGSARPLIDTGLLINSVDYEIE